MKPVEQYRAELATIKAPASLTERLLAVPAQYESAENSENTSTNSGADISANTSVTTTAVSTTNTNGNPREMNRVNSGAAASENTAAQPSSVQATAQPTAQASNAQATPRRAIAFALPRHWKKYALTAAACFMIGVFTTDALGWQVIPRMGSANFATDSASPEMSTTTGSSADAGTMPCETGAVLSSYDTPTLADAATDDIVVRSTEADEVTAISEDTATETARKIIYTTDLTLETTSYDETLAALTETITAAGGYLSYSEAYSNSHSTERSAQLTYRIPATAYQSFFDGLDTLGNITYVSQRANDVTTSYLDIEARITTLTQQRDRLWALQAEAETLSDLLEIEATLTDVLYEIESYQGQLNYLSDQVDYATVSIWLEEVIEYTQIEPTAWEIIRGTASGALTSFIATIGNFLLLLLSLWVWIALAIAAVLVYHSIKRKRTNKNG